jgi:hypothetical protein
MNRYRSLPVSSPRDDDVPNDSADELLTHLLATAKQAIDEHLNRNGVCRCCSAPWPCKTACLAESTLGWF